MVDREEKKFINKINFKQFFLFFLTIELSKTLK